MQTNVELRQQIDALHQELVSLIRAHPHGTIYSHKFDLLWTSTTSQLGWTGGALPTRASRLDPLLDTFPLARRILSLVWLRFRTVEHLPPVAPGLSPVLWSKTDLSFSDKRVPVETIFGFTVCVNAFDDHRYFSEGTNSIETSNTTIFHRLLPNVDYVIDVGANVGFYSMLAAVDQFAGPIVAIEPAQANNAALREGFRLSGLSDRIAISSAAISDVIGDAKLFRTPYGSGGYSLHEAPLHAGGGDEPVVTMTLDSIVAEFGLKGQGLVKLDLEGGEERALRGGIALLSGATPPVLMYEAWPNEDGEAPGLPPDRIARLVRDAGYEVFRVVESRPARTIAQAFSKTYAEFGNYLALPRCMRDLFDKLAEPPDLRDFTPLDDLRRLRDFLQNSVAEWRATATT